MKANLAYKLHNADQVILRRSGEVLTVLAVTIIGRTVRLSCVGEDGRYIQVTNREVK